MLMLVGVELGLLWFLAIIVLGNVSKTRFLRHSLRDSIGTVGNHPLGITILCQCVLFEEINLT